MDSVKKYQNDPTPSLLQTIFKTRREYLSSTMMKMPIHYNFGARSGLPQHKGVLRRGFSSIDHLMEQLQCLDTTVLCDADKTKYGHNQKQQQHQQQPPRISLINLFSVPTNQKTVMVGRAHTVQLEQPNDFLGVLQGLVAAQRGDVLVVAQPPPPLPPKQTNNSMTTN